MSTCAAGRSGMAMNNAIDSSQTNTSTFKFLIGMQSLERLKYFFFVFYVKACSIIFNTKSFGRPVQFIKLYVSSGYLSSVFPRITQQVFQHNTNKGFITLYS